MRFTQIRDFLAVVEAGSLHAAARRLGISQPAVTKSVRSLETELSVQLVHRTTRGIVLTPSGRAFLARARVVQSELAKAQDEIKQSERQGAVAIGVGPTAAVAVVPAALTVFRKRYPDARVHVVEVTGRALFDLVRDEALDMGISARPDGKEHRAFTFRPLYHSQLAVIGRKGHALAKAGSLARLSDAEWLCNTVTLFLERAYSSAGLPLPRRVVQSDSYNAAVGILTKTDAVALMPRRFLSEAMAGSLLQEIRVAEPLPSFTVCLITRADTPLTPVADAMAKAVTTVARNFARRR